MTGRQQRRQPLMPQSLQHPWPASLVKSLTTPCLPACLPARRCWLRSCASAATTRTSFRGLSPSLTGRPQVRWNRHVALSARHRAGDRAQHVSRQPACPPPRPLPLPSLTWPPCPPPNCHRRGHRGCQRQDGGARGWLGGRSRTGKCAPRQPRLLPLQMPLPLPPPCRCSTACWGSSSAAGTGWCSLARWAGGRAGGAASAGAGRWALLGLLPVAPPSPAGLAALLRSPPCPTAHPAVRTGCCTRRLPPLSSAVQHAAGHPGGLRAHAGLQVSRGGGGHTAQLAVERRGRRCMSRAG